MKLWEQIDRHEPNPRGRRGWRHWYKRQIRRWYRHIAKRALDTAPKHYRYRGYTT